MYAYIDKESSTEQANNRGISSNAVSGLLGAGFVLNGAADIMAARKKG